MEVRIEFLTHPLFEAPKLEIKVSLSSSDN